MNLIYEISIAAQLAGSIILSFGCFTKIRENALKMCFPGSNIALRDKNNNCIIDKGLLQKNAQKIILTRYSFICLTVGYLLSIFCGDNTRKPWISFVIVLSIISLMLLFGYLISIVISKEMYKSDQIVPYEQLEKLDVDTCITEEEINSLQ